MKDLLLFQRVYKEGNVANMVINSANLMEITSNKEDPDTSWVKYWDASRGIAASMVVAGTVQSCFTRI